MSAPVRYAVGASFYGGPHDPSTHGDNGSCGGHLTGKMAYAELGMGNALGHLPCGTQLRITYKGKSVIATKMDIGLGGALVQGHPRAIDLWWETAAALGFNGTDIVNVSRPDYGPIPGILGKKQNATKIDTSPLAPAAVIGDAASGVAQGVVDAATAPLKFFNYLTGPDFPKLALGAALLIVAAIEIGKNTGGGKLATIVTKGLK